MRVPLNTLISTSDMLVDGVYDPLTTKQEKAAVRLQRNSRRLLAMLDDFVTYVKADAGDLDLNPQAFDPRVQLGQWCNPVRAACEAKGLSLHVTVWETVPAVLTYDEAVIARIVQALLWNAVSFTAQGEIKVSLDCPSAGECLISVQDSGSGISESDHAQIFEPFWRGEQRPQIPTAGAGLGLPMSRALTRLMGGNLFLKESTPHGSNFCIQLPRRTEKEV